MTSYSNITYNHKNFMVRYAHRKRINITSNLIQKFNPLSIFDYGAGDGELIKLLDHNKIDRIVLFEPETKMRKELKLNLKNFLDCRNLKVVNSQIGSFKKFDMILSIEVLEHLPLPERLKFYNFCKLNLNPNGFCLIEVPIEFGPVLLLKEFGRMFLKKRVSQYSFLKLLKSSFLFIVDDEYNRFDPNDRRTFINPHHGFNFFKFINELNEYGDAKILFNSPFKFFPMIFNQSVFISFKPK